jgi:hypothetical protein
MQYLFLIWCIFLLTGGYSKKSVLQPLLHDLSGDWAGTGFTVIAVPSFTDTNNGFDVKLFHTHETLTFSPIHEKIRNAGAESEIFLSALTYLQRITDINTKDEVHIEPGMWFHQPANSDYDEILWRAGNIPHGNSFLAGSVEFKETKKAPVFENVNSLPFDQGHPDNRPSGSNYTAGYENPKLPVSMVGKYPGAGEHNVVLNPVEFLKQDLAGQTVLCTKMIKISANLTKGGVLNIPFLKDEATADQIEATFYIEKVQEGNLIFWQLQYVQTVIIDFPVFGVPPVISWPHISVATLRKLAGEYL